MCEEDGWEGIHGEAEVGGELCSDRGTGGGGEDKVGLASLSHHLLRDALCIHQRKKERRKRTIHEMVHQLLPCPCALASQLRLRRVEIDLDACEPLLLEHPTPGRPVGVGFGVPVGRGEED